MRDTQLQAIERWFETYTAGYAEAAGGWPTMLRVKVEHSRRVADDMRALAFEIGLPEGDVRTARGLGWLHDIGRFEQYARHRTFRDQGSIDHGTLGLEVLAAHAVLADQAPEARAAIEHGVRHHNVAVVPPDLDARSLTFVRLIRDADKLDIWPVAHTLWKTGAHRREPGLMLHIDCEGPVNPEVLRELRARRNVSYRHIRSLADFFLTQLAWVYDLNFPATYRRVRERGVIDRIADVVPRTPEIEAELQAARTYVAAQGRA